MKRTIAFCNRKGGSGKTTTSVNVAAALAHRGKRVLLIDADPQAHASLSFGIKANRDNGDLYSLLTNGAMPEDVMTGTYLDTLKVIPASRKLLDFEQQYSREKGAGARLAEKIAAMKTTFDFVVFDTPPTLGLMTLSALVASKEIYVPMQAHFLAMEGLAEVVRVSKKLNEMYGLGLGIKGVIPTLFKERNRLSRAIVGEISCHFGESILLHPVRENIALAEAPSHGKTIFQYKLKSHGAYDYLCIADTIREEK